MHNALPIKSKQTKAIGSTSYNSTIQVIHMLGSIFAQMKNVLATGTIVQETVIPKHLFVQRVYLVIQNGNEQHFCDLTLLGMVLV